MHIKYSSIKLKLENEIIKAVNKYKNYIRYKKIVSLFVFLCYMAIEIAVHIIKDICEIAMLT